MRQPGTHPEAEEPSADLDQPMAARLTPWRHLPNILSGLRIILALAFALLPVHLRLPAVVVAGVSDAADGIIARRFRFTSQSGALLDAIADKAFVLSVLLTLLADGAVRWWQVPLVLLRDFLVLGVSVYAGAMRQWSAFSHMRPGIAGKVATGFIFLWFIAVTGGWEVARLPLFVLAASFSALAAVMYLSRFAKALHAAGGGRMHR